VLPSFESVRRKLVGVSVSPHDSSIVWGISEPQQWDLQLVRGFR